MRCLNYVNIIIDCIGVLNNIECILVKLGNF